MTERIEFTHEGAAPASAAMGRSLAVASRDDARIKSADGHDGQSMTLKGSR